MTRTFKIVTDKVVRNPRMERKLIEYNREQYAYYMIMIGGILVIFGVIV